MRKNNNKIADVNTVKTRWCYAVLSLQIIGILVFTLYPMGWAVQKAWYYYTGAPSQTRYVGWENFAAIFTTDSVYWGTWLNTLRFVLAKIPIELALALLLASLLQRGIRGKGLYRVIYFMPSVISVAIVGIVFSNMFDYFGFINAWLIKLGFIGSEIDWFGSGNTAMAALVTGSIWSGFGINTIYFIAAYSNVSKDLYEASALDGANKFQQFIHVTLPQIAPVFQTILLLTLNANLHVNDYILVTTNGAPGGKTFTVMSYLASKYLPGFAEQSVNIGYGCALSIVTSVIMCLIAIGYTKLSAKLQDLN